MKQDWQQWDDATLHLNLWVTQGLILAIAASCSLWLHGWSGTLDLFRVPEWTGIGWAALLAGAVILTSIAMDRYLPRKWQDDGNINERIFGSMSTAGIILVCAAIGIGEEWLFRGVIQPFAGNVWTSVIFTLVHTRYLRKPLLVASMFGTSWLLGFLFDLEQSLWPPILAHTAIDMVLALYLRYTITRGQGEEK